MINTRPYPVHPDALMIPRQTGVSKLNSGDRFIYDFDGRRGWVDGFTQDGDAYVCWEDDGTYDTIRWGLMSSEPDTRDVGQKRMDTAATEIFNDPEIRNQMNQQTVLSAYAEISRLNVADDSWKQTVREIFDECHSDSNVLGELTKRIVAMIETRHPSFRGPVPRKQNFYSDRYRPIRLEVLRDVADQNTNGQGAIFNLGEIFQEAERAERDGDLCSQEVRTVGLWLTAQGKAKLRQ